MKRTRAWSKKGPPAVVTVPTTRANTNTILGAISASGLIKVSLRIPKPSKKRRAGQESGYLSTGHYLVMDNTPIHKSEDIPKYITTSRGYRCAYLLSYSPELNSIEQFWSVAKSEVKRHRFLEQGTLLTRIREACNSVELSDFHGFVSYSHSCWGKCRNRENT
ncbi:hypothetical protein VTP01DRAFT_2217 [Rhizomucor pusillus]|uniref:uncharacterized protein n=1 Tax=Rhizomucor pusillus TaxID=4840 RepID=UPI0037426474